MTKKDYIIVAKVLAKAFATSTIDGTQGLIDLLCPAFKNDNPNFDAKRFEDFVWSEAKKLVPNDYRLK